MLGWWSRDEGSGDGGGRGGGHGDDVLVGFIVRVSMMLIETITVGVVAVGLEEMVK